MRKSARILGEEWNLSGQEMNWILEKEGYLEGEPGHYTATEKGRRFVHEDYPEPWGLRTWDEEIMDDFDMTNEKAMEAKKAVLEARRKKMNERMSEEPDDTPLETSYDEQEEFAQQSGYEWNVLAPYIGVVLALSFIAVPLIKRWWVTRAVPQIKKARNQVTDKNKIVHD